MYFFCNKRKKNLGEGWSSLFKGLLGGLTKVAKKAIPAMSKVAKNIGNSQIVKGASKQLVDSSVNMGTSLLADLVNKESLLL